jgi:hypothetical protein
VSRKVTFVVLIVGVVIAAGVFVGTHRSHTPSTTDQSAMRETIVRYAVEREPVIPATMYGKKLDIDRCITLLRTRAMNLAAVATSSAVGVDAADWLYLQTLRGQLRELHGALPVACTGRIVYWDVVGGSGDRYTVRAAVLPTLTSATWDATRQRLVGRSSGGASATTADEYTMQRIGGVWKITSVKPWKFYDIPGGLNCGG